MKVIHRFERYAGIGAVALIFVGCFVVVRPFLSALLWAAILVYAAWPCYVWVRARLGGRRTLAAVIMTTLIAVVMVIPFVLVGLTLADNIAWIVKKIEEARSNGLPALPGWVEKIPLIGVTIAEYWQDLNANTQEIAPLIAGGVMRSHRWIVRNTAIVGQGILQLCLSMFIAFFFFRSGETMVAQVAAALQRLLGETTQRLLAVVGVTIKSVVYSLFGTALSQAAVAGIGFWIAPVPAPLFWAFVTFVMALIPNGPPLVWVPMTVWLALTRHHGWAVFMGLWGALGISMIDNVVRPYLISRGNTLPFVLILLGVLGGVLTFGFVGLFIGPTLLACGYCLAQEFISGARVEGAGVEADTAEGDSWG
ncbi:MAG: AI-2E family transporter [bacterium]|nr:AI-2E family transporter [bacterium]